MKKILLDIFMFLIFLILMFMNITGVILHEILGILIFILVVIHIIINRKWLFSVSKSINNSKMKTKYKFMCIIDWIMISLVLILTISGMVLSVDVFSFIPNYNYDFSYRMHLYLSDLEIIIMFIHLGLHLNEIYKKFKVENIQYYIKLTIVFLTIMGSYFTYRDVIKSCFSNSSSNNDNSNNSNSNSNNNDSNSVIETLKEYLSKLHCKGCGKNCILSNPRCGRSEPYIEQATQDYNEKYGITDGVSYSYSLNDDFYTMIVSSKI